MFISHPLGSGLSVSCMRPILAWSLVLPDEAALVRWRADVAHRCELL